MSKCFRIWQGPGTCPCRSTSRDEGNISLDVNAIHYSPLPDFSQYVQIDHIPSSMSSLAQLLDPGGGTYSLGGAFFMRRQDRTRLSSLSQSHFRTP